MFDLGDKKLALVNQARKFFQSYQPHQFSDNEQTVLNLFFTNLDRQIFFMFGLLTNVGISLLAMYSRLKDDRGIRGTFVGPFLLHILTSQVKEVEARYQQDPQAKGVEANYLRQHQIKTLDGFVNYSNEHRIIFLEFTNCASGDPSYLTVLAQSRRVKTFLSTWLDFFNHNSIGRVGNFWICCEDISVLAAKSLEWSRPGTGFIELSTRFVTRSKAGVYPIWNEFSEYGINKEATAPYLDDLFVRYQKLSGDNFDGPLPRFYEKKYRHRFEDPAELAMGITGETCDVLGNLLPCATLTSVAVASSGEALPSILRHLILDGTPENLVLVEMISEEAGKVGADQFIQFYQPTPSQVIGWEYLSIEHSAPSEIPGIWDCYLPPDAQDAILRVFQSQWLFNHCNSLEACLRSVFSQGRDKFDRLPREFEVTSAMFLGTMSFRSWRDLHRMSLSTHKRSLVTPDLGFYQYPKPHPSVLTMHFNEVRRRSRTLHQALDNVPEFLRQYLLPMGWNVNFLFAGNLRQLEFCNWQRTKPSVNDEVRRTFIAMENLLRMEYPWWPLASRANLTPAYLFARSKSEQGISLEDNLK